MQDETQQEIHNELQEVDGTLRPASAEPDSPPSEVPEGPPQTPREKLRREQFEILYSQEHAEQLSSEEQTPATTEPAPEQEGSDPPGDEGPSD